MAEHASRFSVSIVFSVHHQSGIAEIKFCQILEVYSISSLEHNPAFEFPILSTTSDVKGCCVNMVYWMIFLMPDDLIDKFQPVTPAPICINLLRYGLKIG